MNALDLLSSLYILFACRLFITSLFFIALPSSRPCPVSATAALYPPQECLEAVEGIIDSTVVHAEDDEQEHALKLALIDVYNRRLVKRLERKTLASAYGLNDPAAVNGEAPGSRCPCAVSFRLAVQPWLLGLLSPQPSLSAVLLVIVQKTVPKFFDVSCALSGR